MYGEEWMSISCIGDDEEKEKFFKAVEDFAYELAKKMKVPSKVIME